MAQPGLSILWITVRCGTIAGGMKHIPGAIVLLSLTLGSVKGAEGVVLLHGMSRSSASMAKMERALASEGYVVVNCDYSTRTEPIEKLSLAVIGGALTDERLCGCSKVHFVTHSIGG